MRALFVGKPSAFVRDPYANAFYADATKEGEWKKDVTDMKPGLHERKWELDSLCYPIRLAYHYWKITGDTSPFDADWIQAMQLVLKTCREQQRKTNRGPYHFSRCNLLVDGYGAGRWLWQSNATDWPDKQHVPPIRRCYGFSLLCTIELVCGGFVPATGHHDRADYVLTLPFAKDCRALADEVEGALKKYAIYTHPKYGKIYAMEVDGYGNHLLQDDANVPNLLALPYLGACSASDPIYQNTRRFVLSPDNPYFFKGKAAEGVGSPHTLVNNIWTMSLTMRALTSTNDQEILAQLRQLKKTHAGTGFMHESFDKDDPAKFTRKWFAWANTLFGELILKIAAERPHLLAKAL